MKNIVCSVIIGNYAVFATLCSFRLLFRCRTLLAPVLRPKSFRMLNKVLFSRMGGFFRCHVELVSKIEVSDYRLLNPEKLVVFSLS